MQVVADTSLLIGLLNSQDVWSQQARALLAALDKSQAEIIYFDCVIAETISTSARRLREKGRGSEVSALLTHINTLVDKDRITWIFPDMQRLYLEVLDLVESSSSELNFNDALIALACKEYQIEWIASFDADFDQIGWLRRISDAQDIPSE